MSAQDNHKSRSSSSVTWQATQAACPPPVWKKNQWFIAYLNWIQKTKQTKKTPTLQPTYFVLREDYHTQHQQIDWYILQELHIPNLLVDWNQLACNWLIPTWSVLKVTKAVEGNSWLDKAADCPVIASRLPKSKHELDGHSGYLSCFDSTYLY